MHALIRALELLRLALVSASLLAADTVAAQAIVADPGIRIGSSTTLTIVAGVPNAPYRLALGASGSVPGVALPGGRVIPLNPPWIHADTQLAHLRVALAGFEGVTDAFGVATATLDIPPDDRLAGVRIHAVFVTLDPGSPDGIGVISPPEKLELVAEDPSGPGQRRPHPATAASNPWNVMWPEDIPPQHRPALPAPPQVLDVTAVSGGNHTLSASDTEYRLTANVGHVSVAPGTQRIVIDGMGFAAASIRLPSVWPIPGPVRVNDIVIRNIVLSGGSNGSAIEGACLRLLLQNVMTQPGTISRYCLYTRFSEDLVIEECDLRTLGDEACVRLVDVKRFAGFRSTFHSDVKHAFRIHFSSHDIWLSDTVCGSALYIGYQQQLAGRAPTDLRNVMLRRLEVYPQPGGNVMQITSPAYLDGFDMSDCTFHSDGPLTQNQVNAFMATANGTPGWTYSNLVVLP